MDLYKEEVMDHYEHPRNRGELVGENVILGQEVNASCGDSVQFYIKITKVPNTRVPQGSELKIIEVRWEGAGCAIMTASASKLSEYLQGLALKDIKEMSEDELLHNGVGFEVNPGRIKCLMLPVKVVKKLVS
ncbi:MAG: iron-sulfur cluster assembly scaffold protein [Microgenomates group bacterium]